MSDDHVRLIAGDVFFDSVGVSKAMDRAMSVKKTTLVRNIGDWMLLIDPNKICIVPPGEVDPDTCRHKMPPMKWVHPDDTDRLMAMLAMIDNRQELEQFLPEFYARGVDELL